MLTNTLASSKFHSSDFIFLYRFIGSFQIYALKPSDNHGLELKCPTAVLKDWSDAYSSPKSIAPTISEERAMALLGGVDTALIDVRISDGHGQMAGLFLFD
jgi:hypothetical protein